jgi:hypothetical protein
MGRAVPITPVSQSTGLRLIASVERRSSTMTAIIPSEKMNSMIGGLVGQIADEPVDQHDVEHHDGDALGAVEQARHRQASSVSGQ